MDLAHELQSGLDIFDCDNNQGYFVNNRLYNGLPAINQQRITEYVGSLQGNWYSDKPIDRDIYFQPGEGVHYVIKGTSLDGKNEWLLM
jgi:hypothetical protein